MSDFRGALEPIASTSTGQRVQQVGERSTRILRELAPQLLHPRILNSPAFAALPSGSSAAASSSSSSSSLTLSGPNSAFVSIARLRNNLPLGASSSSSSSSTRSYTGFGFSKGKHAITSTDLRIIEDIDRLLALPIPLPSLAEEDEQPYRLLHDARSPADANANGIVGLLAGFQATIPSASERKLARRRRRARISERALGLSSANEAEGSNGGSGLGLRELGERARGLLTTSGDDASSLGSESVDATPRSKRTLKNRRRTTLHPAHSALAGLGKPPQGQNSSNAGDATSNDVVEELSKSELEAERREIILDKEALEVRRKLFKRDLGEVEGRIQQLEDVKRELEKKMLGLREEDLDLDDELEGISDRLQALEARNAGRIVSSQSSRRRRGPAFLPSEHDELPPNVCFMTLAPSTTPPPTTNGRLHQPPHAAHMRPFPSIGPPPISAIDFSEPYGTLVSASSDSAARVRVYDLTDGSEIAQLRGHRGTVKCLLVEGSSCITGGSDGKIALWDLDVAVEEEQERLDAEEKDRTYIGRRLREDDDDVFFAGPPAAQRTKETKPTQAPRENGSASVAASQSREDASSSINEQPQGPRARLKILEGHSKDVTCLSYEDTSLVSGSSDKTLRLWDLNTGQCVVTMDILWAISNPLPVEADDGIAQPPTTAAGANAPASASSTSTEPHMPTLPTLSNIAALSSSPYRTSPSRTSSYESDYPWRTSSSLVTPSRRQASLSGLRRLSSTYSLSSYAAGTGSPTTPSASNVNAFNFSQPTPPFSDGSWEMYSDFVGGLQLWSYALASGSADGCVRMWDTRTGQSVRSLWGHTRAVTCLQFDSQYLVSGSLDQSVRVWDLRTGRTVDTLKYDGPVTALQFDTRRILVAGGTNAVNVYNRTTLQQTPLTINGHTSPVERLRFMDRYLATGGKDGMVKIWSLA